MEKKQEEIASAESNGMIEGTWHRLSDEKKAIMDIFATRVTERSSGNYNLTLTNNHAPRRYPATFHQADICWGLMIAAIIGSMKGVGRVQKKIKRGRSHERGQYWKHERGRSCSKKKRGVGRMKGEDKERVLPLCSKDKVANTEPKQEDLNLKSFLRSTFWSMLHIPPNYHWMLLLLCVSFLSYQAKTMMEPFDHQIGKSTSTPQIVQMNFLEAIFVFFPEMTHIAMFILCYSLSWMLVLSLPIGVLICFVLLLISAPLFYFPELGRKASASGIDVACGFVKLPLIWFTSLGALVISFICALLTLVAVYIIWKFINEGRPNDNNDIEDGLDLDGFSSEMMGA